MNAPERFWTDRAITAEGGKVKVAEVGNAVSSFFDEAFVAVVRADLYDAQAAEIADLRRQLAEAREVKPLEWIADGPDAIMALDYRIEADGHVFRCFGPQEIRKRPEYAPWPTVEAAKAAAQADYEARILSALKEPPNDA